MNIKCQSAGGKATAIILKQKAIDDYYQNPNICLYCGNVIKIKDDQKCSEVRRLLSL